MLQICNSPIYIYLFIDAAILWYVCLTPLITLPYSSIFSGSAIPISVSYTHELGKLTLTSIGTSQEGADVSTIREIALMCKMAGTDLHHLGDSGYMGMALPENILEYGKVIRGVRHTYHRMAASIKR